MSDVENVKNRLDIVDLIGSYIELKRAGSNFKGLCPFHNEKTPSFMVNPNLQIYKCFGCGRGGDSLNFIEEYERVDFPEALKIAAEKAGVELTGNFQKGSKKNDEEKMKIIEVNKLAAKFYSYLLKSHKIGEVGRKYASKRKIGAKEIKKFEFGYAPKGKENLKKYLLKHGYEENDLIKWGLLVNRDGKIIDKFRDRLLQPVRDVKGNIVGFSGRYTGTFEGAPKYLNSPETLVFKKNELLYGLFEGQEKIRKEKNIILVEGNIDVVSSHRVGVENIVAPLGTAFTEGQAKLIKRYADEILVCFDSDEAGQNALIRSLGILEKQKVKHKVIDLGEYQDADELINDKPEMWLDCIKQPKNTVEYILSKYIDVYDLGNPDDKSMYLSRSAAIIRMLGNEVQKEHFTKEISRQTGISIDLVKEEIQTGSRVKKMNNKQSRENIDDKEMKTTNSKNKAERLVALLLMLGEDGKKSEYKIDSEVLETQIPKRVVDLIISTNGKVKKTEIDKLEEEEKVFIQEAMLMDVRVEDIYTEFRRLYNPMLKEFINNKIKALSNELIEKPDDDELLKKVDELTKKIALLSN